MTGCPPHHWLVSEPTLHYTRPNNKGDLVERTKQKCKKCGIERLNDCVLPQELDGAATEETE